MELGRGSGLGRGLGLGLLADREERLVGPAKDNRVVVSDDHAVQPLPPLEQALERRNDQSKHHQVEDEPARREGEQHELVPGRRGGRQAGLCPGVEEDAPRQPQGLRVEFGMGQLQARIIVVTWIAPTGRHPCQRTAQDQEGSGEDEQCPVANVRAKHCAGECVACPRPQRPEKWTHRWSLAPERESGRLRSGARSGSKFACYLNLGRPYHHHHHHHGSQAS